MASDSSSSKCYDFVAEVDGLVRIIRGVQLDTTCHDIVNVLSRATGRKKAQVLVEVWQGCVRKVAPYERPLLLWAQWGRHKKQVSFALRDASVFSPVKKKRVRGFPVCHKALRRARAHMKRFKDATKRRVERARRVRNLLSKLPGGVQKKEKKEGEVMELLLESLRQKEAHLVKKRDRLSSLAQLLARRQRERGGGKGTYEECSDQINDVISRLEHELSLRSNVYRSQSSKVRHTYTHIRKHTHKHAHIHTQTHTHTYTHTHARAHTHHTYHPHTYHHPTHTSHVTPPHTHNTHTTTPPTLHIPPPHIPPPPHYRSRRCRQMFCGQRRPFTN